MNQRDKKTWNSWRRNFSSNDGQGWTAWLLRAAARFAGEFRSTVWLFCINSWRRLSQNIHENICLIENSEEFLNLKFCFFLSTSQIVLTQIILEIKSTRMSKVETFLFLRSSLQAMVEESFGIFFRKAIWMLICRCWWPQASRNLRNRKLLLARVLILSLDSLNSFDANFSSYQLAAATEILNWISRMLVVERNASVPVDRVNSKQQAVEAVHDVKQKVLSILKQMNAFWVAYQHKFSQRDT